MSNIREKTLLEIAMAKKVSVRTQSEYTSEKGELAYAYLIGEITLRQFTIAYETLRPGLKMSGGSALYKVATLAREGIRRGEIKISFKEGKDYE